MITTDTLLLAGEARAFGGGGLAFDLGAGEGEVAGLVPGYAWVGVDICLNSLRRAAGVLLPVLARVEDVPGLFPRGIADLVTANPLYFVLGTGRQSPDAFREQARRGNPLLLYSFVFAAAHLLKPGGQYLMTCRPGTEKEVLVSVKAAGMEIGEWRPEGKVGLLKARVRTG